MDAQSTIPHARLPAHGPITCRRCYTNTASVAEAGPWRAVNDPGAWGSATPEVLVLGFSKGFTQANAFAGGDFDAVPFARMRPRLSEVLQVLGLLAPGERVDDRMRATERTLAFGSLVRCSLSRWNERAKRHECTGTVVPKAFREEVAAMVRTCARTFLADLPASVRLVVMLGTTDAYIEGCKSVVRSLNPATFRTINDVSYRTGPVIWTHASHPSPLNGWHEAWVSDPSTTTSGRKRALALEVVAGARMHS